MLRKFWNFLFKCCEHKWEVVDKGNILNDGEIVGKYYHLQCSKCGDIKERRF